jgi:hypothetical protein
MQLCSGYQRLSVSKRRLTGPVVVWLQFALLAVVLGPIAKGAIVFVGAVALSWGIVAALRRVPVIARVL